MAKKTKHKEEFDLESYNSNIESSEIKNYVKDSMLKYGINVSVFRACIAALDGLSPVKRRMIYTFYLKGATNDKKRVKANTLLGPVGTLHPHGEMSINKTFANEIKPWETNAPLLDTWGNCGSLTGAAPAPTRYLETRLSKFAMECFFNEFDEEICDMVESNTREMKEPVTIPSKYPYFLLSNNVGIGWGNSMTIPPFNLTEVFKLTQALLMNPNLEGVYLYPDSPRGYNIVRNDNIREICDAGRGTLKIQATIKYGEVVDDHGKVLDRYLSVKNFPEQVFLDQAMKEITTLIKDKNITGIRTMKDKTSLDNFEFWVMLTPDANPEFVKDMLYRKTHLRSYVAIDMNFAGRTHMQPMGLKEALLFWIDNRIDIKQKYLLKKLSRIKAKIHENEGVIYALDGKRINRTVDIVRHAKDEQDCIEKLQAAYNISSYQAKAIYEIKLNKINILTQEALIGKNKELTKESIQLTKVVTNREAIKDTIYQELEDGIKMFGKPRACPIVDPSVLESPVHHHKIVVTKKYIKKLSTDCKGVGTVESDDTVVGVFPDVPENTSIRLIDTVGRCYAIPLDRLKTNEPVAKGTPLIAFNMIGTTILAFTSVEDELAKKLLLTMFTKNGFVKATYLDQYMKSRMSIPGIDLDTSKGDEVCYAIITDKTINTLVYTKQGRGINFKVPGVVPTDRITKGSRVLNIEDGDVIQGIFMYDPKTDKDILVVTEKGCAKRCELDDIFQTSKRRASMVRITSLLDDDNVFTIVPIRDVEKYICVLQSGEKVDLMMDKIPKLTRLAKPKKMIPVKRGDSIVKIR